MADNSGDGAPSPHATTSEDRIVGLDGLRAISIILVVLGHGWSKLPLASELDFANPYLGNATLGVRTFFVISGFLITYLLRREWDRTGKIWITGFYARRVLRIFPAMYTYLLVLVGLRFAGRIATTCGDLTCAALFLTDYAHFFSLPTNDDYWFVGHFWTLSLEEQFYLLWPATIVACGLARADKVALAIVVLSPLVRVVSYLAFPGLRPQIPIMLHTAADPIMIGCLAAIWSGRPRFESALARLSSWYWPCGAIVFVGFIAPWLAERFRGTYDQTIGVTLSCLAVTFVMLWVIRRPSSRATKLLSIPLLTHIGVLSYSLYLWQQLFLAPGERWSKVFPLELCACFIAAEASYRLIEQPILRLRRRFRPATGTAH